VSGKCTLVTKLGVSCSTSGDCDSNAECICDYTDGTSHCEADVLEQNEIDALSAFFQCLEDNNCGSQSPFPEPKNCVAEHCLSKWKDVFDLSGSNPCSATAVVSSLFLVLSALLFLM